MAGTARDFSAVLETEGKPCTTSATQDEVDVITPPSWATFYAVLSNTTDLRLGLNQSETMTTASVLEATDEHSVIKATSGRVTNFLEATSTSPVVERPSTTSSSSTGASRDLPRLRTASSGRSRVVGLP